MKKQKNFQAAIIAVLAVTVLALGIGFAAYTQSLKINGTATVAANKWSVHFVEGSFDTADKSKEITKSTITDTSVTFETELSKPGDFAAFSVDIINDGTFDAILNKVTMTDVSDKPYLKYTINYNNIATFTATRESLKVGLAATEPDTTHTVTFRVEYVEPSDSTKLPSEDVKVELSAIFDYTQN